MRKAAVMLCSLAMAGVLLAGGTLAALPGQSAAQKLAAGEQVWGTISKAAGMVRDAIRIMTGADRGRQDAAPKPASPAKGAAKAASPAPQPKQAVPAAGGKSATRKLGAGEGNVNARDETARAIEEVVLRELNRVRKEHGLQELRLNEQVAEMARLKSIEVMETGIVTHNSAKYGYMTDMYDKAGLHYATAGEVMYQYGSRSAGLARDANRVGVGAVKGWLESPGHRRQILEPAFQEVGIGVAWVPRLVLLRKQDTGEEAEMAVCVFALFLAPSDRPKEHSDFPSIKDIIKGPGGG